MKKLLLLLIVFGFAGQSWGQERIKTIELNFKNKKFNDKGLKEIEDLRKGDFYQLKIDSINMNLYKLVVDKKDTIVVSNVKFPVFDLASLGSIGELLGKINFSTTSSANNPFKNNTWSLQKEEGNIKINDDIKNIKTLIEENKKELLANAAILDSYKKSIDELLIIIQKRILRYSVLNENDSNYKLLSHNVSLTDILEQTSLLRTNLNSMSKKLAKQQTAYLDVSNVDGTKNLIENNPELKEADKIIKEAYAQSISDANKLYESVNAEKVGAWLKELIYKDNNSTFSYTTLPMQLNGDQTKLNIQIIPNQGENGLPSYKTEIQFPQKKEFYVGVGMSFYVANFKNEIYSTEATVVNDSITNYRIVNEKNERGEIGVATLIHFGWRPFYYDRDNDVFAVNLVTGPALSLASTIKPRIAIGGGLAFGRKNMLTINALFMGGYVDKKSEVYNTESTYNSIADVTVSKLESSIGVSLGYIYDF